MILAAVVVKADAWGHGSAVSVVPPRAPSSWVNGAFATCVRHRESHDGHDPNAGGNLYGVKGAPDRNGNPYSWARGVPRVTQDYIAYQLYVRYGVQPWRPYDGC